MTQARRPPRPAVAIFLRLLFIAITVVILEGVARLAFARLLPDWEKVRRALTGDAVFQPGYQKTSDQAYLLYIPTPNMPVDGEIDHNSQGYRGKAVTMDRVPGVYRILCLGGSTTYGWSVHKAHEAYPAQLEQLLNQDPPSGYPSVEVINGGLPYGTSAEELNSYHFKFHYYRPDLVIIHTGGNDAEGMIQPNYHPDYSNWRQAPIPIRPLRRASQWLLRSRLLSAVYIPMTYGQNPSEPSFVRDGAVAPLAVWYPRATTSRARLNRPTIPLPEYAFAHNTESLILEAKRDGANVLLMPFREAPRHRYPNATIEGIALNRKLLGEFATKYDTGFAPFPSEAITPKNWVDSCHVNAAGNLEMAQHLLPFVRQLIAK